jgi:Ca2+-binding RTX toxin-like protein
VAIINGTSENDTLTGTAGTDYLFGWGGHDTLNGGAGGDQMEGGLGDDYYIVDNVGDAVIEAAGAGDDGVSSALAYYVLPANVESLNFWAMASVVNVHGIGNALDNLIYGLNGNDILDGGAGADMLHGGLGDDTYYFDHVGDWTDEEADEGYDTIYTSVVPAPFLQSAIERLVYTGNANVTITGGWRDNDITTGGGHDVIDGGGGNDTMRGRAGDDVYFVDSAQDYAIEHPGEASTPSAPPCRNRVSFRTWRTLCSSARAVSAASAIPRRTASKAAAAPTTSTAWKAPTR